VEGLIEFDASLPVSEQPWDFAADFVAGATAPASAAKSLSSKTDDDIAWLFQLASRAEDFGAVECRHGWVNVSDRVSALVQELSEFGRDPVRRAEALAEVAELRLICRRTDGWRSEDYEWPLLSK
jgi:hypothetical protein